MTGKKENPNVIYIHGRPGPHPMHRKFSEAVGAKFQFVDFKMRWQDLDKNILYRITSWLVCAFTFPDKKKYDIILVDNLHIYPAIMKSLGLLRRNQKIVVHMGSHTLYFMYAHRFSKLTERLHLYALKKYDAIICEGKMADVLTRKMLGEKTPRTYTVFNGIPEEHIPTPENHTQNLFGRNIIFMGHGPNENRLWYKGLDLMLDAFELALEKDKELTFTIVGNWENDTIDQLLSKYKVKTKKAVHFVGETNDLGPYTRNASLYMHTARGEAFGITIIIAMAAGIPALVSEWTGAKEVVEQADERLIVPLDAQITADRINWYFNLSNEEKKNLSEKSRKATEFYTAKNAIDFYKTTFDKITIDLGI